MQKIYLTIHLHRGHLEEITANINSKEARKKACEWSKKYYNTSNYLSVFDKTAGASEILIDKISVRTSKDLPKKEEK